ncbi:hypothetical protein IWQ57_000458 [Coemansia nantahalensis]|uniref:Uncharacterized protein n=1 Tax=Coemansia nantahalensis TaxID=2789366 RepID=A0ACC1K824_9FUNG|nr:hypothetical protein IWQ57_000458 [Coemansia nantahalensis]
MKIAAAALALALSLGAVALTDRDKDALARFGARAHPVPHTKQDLVAELSEYAASAGLTDAMVWFTRRQYATATAALGEHARAISKDPLVQHGAPLAGPFMMLNDCTNELSTMV